MPDESWPASSNVRDAEYPRIHADLRVTFRLVAPTAQKVQVQSPAFGPYDMVRDAEGAWTVTTPPLVPGFHYYSLLVDGVAVNDPSSRAYYGYNKMGSGINVPEPGVDFYEPHDVPQGEVRERWYHSRTTGAWRRVMVYTPPDYDAHPDTRYPVLYLQHGASEDETGWTQQGHANFILDNLIAAGRAKPMLIVMDCGYAARPGKPLPALFADPKRVRQRIEQMTTVFGEVLLHDVIPLIDATYRTSPDREHRALAGLSMGSMQTRQIGFANLETFAAFGLLSGPPFGRFSPKTSYDGAFRDAEAFNQRVRVFWMGAGSAETDIARATRKLHDTLEAAGIRHVWCEYEGLAHEWQTWRKSLYDLAPLLFQD
jgi:enterochelin esterase-like enzyme